MKTLGHDRTEKLVYYASNDISEYWIVNLQNQTLEGYHHPSGDEYRERRTLKTGNSTAPQLDDALGLDAADVFLARPSQE